jgi:arylsulfatase A-like enzyme
VIDATSRPNVLVVVFDALRASDFPGGTTPVGDMPTTERLMGDSYFFPLATSVTPWTIPAHASILTGLYPWEHGCHAKQNLILRDEVPRVPSALRAAGYRTALLSSNTLVCPRFGLTEGFDFAAWGQWWEPYVRTIGNGARRLNVDVSKQSERFSDRFRDGPVGRWVRDSTETFYRYPILFDSLDLLSQRLRRPGLPRDISTSGWIEPTLRSWLAAQPEQSPVFCLINVCDTHEPYFVPDGVDHGVGAWLRQSTVRQDFVRCISGEWKPTTSELAVLRELYRATVRNSDRRLTRIIEAFQAAGRWDNTILFATSDHGQAFGEHGELFHLNGVIDPMLRIPLLYRPPGGVAPPKRARGWASLIDLAPTIFGQTGVSGTSSPAAVELDRLLESSRAEPAFAVSDGLVWNHLKKVVPESRRPEFDRLRVVAYWGENKLIFDSTQGTTIQYDLSRDPGESFGRPAGPGDGPSAELESARTIATQMTATAPVPLAKDVEERLRGWGYV